MKFFSWKREWKYVFVAFFLPLIYFWTVFTGRSFGFECAPGVMGNSPPYGQTWQGFNFICYSLPDPGAYTWEYPPYWLEVARQYMSGQIPIWVDTIGLGIPFAANFHSSVYFLPLLPFIFLFEKFNANMLFIDLFFVFRYMIIASGMYVFLRSLGLARGASLAGALAFFSVGYFVQLPNVSQHNVDILLPWIGYGFNQLNVLQSKKWVGVTAIFIGLSMIGGMPESSIFILFFSAIYVLFLSLEGENFKGISWKLFIYGSVSILIGLLMGSIVYIPGFEHVLQATSTHHDGSEVFKSISWQHLFYFVYPEIFSNHFVRGTLIYNNHIPFKLYPWNYVGTIMTFLYSGAITLLITKWRLIKNDPYLQLLTFFTVLAFILFLQTYDLVSFLLFAYFPVFKETNFPKYASTLLDFSFITAACMYLHILFKQKSKTVFVAIGVMVFFAIIATLTFKTTYDQMKPYLLAGEVNKNVLLGIIYACVICGFSYLSKLRKYLPLVILVLLVTEFYNYLPKDGYLNRYDSFREPPGVTFLKERNDGHYRILGTDNLLYPNIATAYDLKDMRMLDALFTYRYHEFLTRFYAEPYYLRITGLMEQNKIVPANITTNPFFDLLSVKYILSYNSLETLQLDTTALMQKIIEENPTQQKNTKYQKVTVNNEEKPFLFAHAPTTLLYTTIKPEGATRFITYPMFTSESFVNKQGDGVTFLVRIYQDEVLLAENSLVLDPKKVTDPQWQPLNVGPLTPERQKITIELSTLPNTSNNFDWSGWAGLYWDSQVEAVNNKYKLVYDKEMKIYENVTALPRLTFMNKTICTATKKDDTFDHVVSVMKKHSETIRTTAVIEDDNCTSQNFNSSVISVRNQTWNDQKITFTYSSPSPQYAVLHDLYYPGWEVYINDKKEEIQAVNLAFRGFELPPGEDIEVRVVYLPWTFYIGATITMLMILLSLLLIFLPPILYVKK